MLSDLSVSFMAIKLPGRGDYGGFILGVFPGNTLTPKRVFVVA